MSTRERTEGLAKLHSHFKMESISQQGSISGQGLVSHSHFEPYSTVLTLCSENSIQASNENGGLRYLNKHENYLWTSCNKLYPTYEISHSAKSLERE